MRKKMLLKKEQESEQMNLYEYSYNLPSGSHFSRLDAQDDDADFPAQTVPTARKLIKKEDRPFRTARKKNFGSRLSHIDMKLGSVGLSRQTPPSKKIYESWRHESQMTPVKACESSEELESFRKEFGFSPKICQGYKVYRLNSLNSISNINGQIFDLLSENIGSERQRKQTTCKCSHSKCQAGYCQCFSKGQKCKEQCRCVNCQNKISPLRESQVVFRGCKCEKSNCQKRYCACLQEGMKCQDWCQCLNCMNRQIGIKKMPQGILGRVEV